MGILDDVKQAADYVCEDNNHDGLARFIEEHVLTEVDA